METFVWISFRRSIQHPRFHHPEIAILDSNMSEKNGCANFMIQIYHEYNIDVYVCNPKVLAYHFLSLFKIKRPLGTNNS